MQEEVEQKTVALVISAGKLTGRELKKAIVKLLAHLKDKKSHPHIPQGKQSVKQLAKQGQGMTSIEITDQNIKDFERVAKKYGVDFAVMKDKTEIPPKYVVFFKGKDADAITNAFKEYTADMVKKAARPSVLAELRKLAQIVKNTVVDKLAQHCKTIDIAAFEQSEQIQAAWLETHPMPLEDTLERVRLRTQAQMIGDEMILRAIVYS